MKQNGCVPSTNNEKIVLTSKQLKNLITRIRINQMEEDGFYRKQIQKRLNCHPTAINKWGQIGFDNPRAFLEGVRTSRPEVSRTTAKSMLRKRTTKVLL